MGIVFNEGPLIFQYAQDLSYLFLRMEGSWPIRDSSDFTWINLDSPILDGEAKGFHLGLLKFAFGGLEEVGMML